MKKLKINFLDNFSHIIYFESNFYQGENIFIATKNIKISVLETPCQRYYLNLKDNLNLKYFKMEIS
jgi:hypothetical protein